VDVLFGVRMRTTVAASAVVAIALVVGAYGLVRAQRSLGVDQVDAAITTRAGDLALLLRGGGEPATLDVARQEEALVQIVDADGRVVAASENVVGLPPVADPGAIGIDTVSDLAVDPGEEFRLLTNKVLTDDGLVTIIVAGSLDPLAENVDILVRNLAVALPLFLTVMGVVTWLIVGRALRPVDAIRTEVESIGEQRLDRRVPEPRARDEVGRLARTMNGMLARLQESWRRQEQFVADASHELRTPLTVMRAQLEVDGRHPETSDVAVTQAALLDEIDQLEQLLDDLLFLARGDAGGRDHRSVDLDDVVMREVERIRAVTDRTVDATQVSAGQVRGDRAELGRVVRNLLANAARHARSTITVGLGEQAGTVVLSVADDGPGIPPDARDEVFERFVRLDAARTRGAGAGLGLAIARDIVERHGGTVAVVDSSAGARVVVRLPAVPHH
jgi:signal transduction histidine kinase